jgi:hypothetical protein
VTAEVPRDLPAARGEADQDHLTQVKHVHERREVVGVVVHVVPVPDRGGSPVPPAVVRDGTEAVGRQVELLGLPAVAAEAPAMAEHDGLSVAPVLVEDVDAIGDGDEGHGCTFDTVQSLVIDLCDRSIAP